MVSDVLYRSKHLSARSLAGVTHYFARIDSQSRTAGPKSLCVYFKGCACDHLKPTEYKYSVRVFSHLL